MLLQAKKELIGESNIYKDSSCLNKCINKQRSFSCILTLVGLSNFPSCSIFSSRALERDLVLPTLMVELESSSPPSSSPLKEEVGEEPREEWRESLSRPLGSSPSPPSSSLSSSSSSRGLLFKKRFNVKLLSL